MEWSLSTWRMRLWVWIPVLIMCINRWFDWFPPTDSTPNLDALAQDGLQLNNYYVQHMCTPSRHSLMSGRYPISDGMQESSIGDTQPYGMPLDLVTLPEMLKTSGYKTHIIWFVPSFQSEWSVQSRRGIRFYKHIQHFRYRSVLIMRMCSL